MSRIRTIKPDFFQNEKLSALPPEAHILAAGLLCYADDEGYFLANPKLIEAAIFPLRELSMSLPVLLQKLIGINYIEIISANDRQYGRVVKFLEHQCVSHPSPSKLKEHWKPPVILQSLPVLLQPELNRRELNGIEGKGSEPPSFDDLKPSEAARMFLEHEDICIPVSKFELADTEAAIEAIQRQEKLLVFPALEWLLEQARKVKASGKKVGPGWARKTGYNDVTAKKQLPMQNPAEVKKEQARAAGVNL